jgi:hypothetical protein
MASPRRAQNVLRSIRQSIPTGVVLGRRSAGNGPAEFIPLDEAVSAQLDDISSTRGSVLYRGASAWQALAPGTSGQFLRTNGAGADPSWAAASGGSGGGAWSLDSSYTPSGGVITVTIPANEDRILLVGQELTYDTDSVELRARFSVSGTPVSANGSYAHTSFRHFASGSGVTGEATGNAAAAANSYMALGISNQGNAAAEETNFNLELCGAADSARLTAMFGQVSSLNEFSADVQHVTFHGHRKTAQVNDEVEFFAESGNIDGGTIYLYTLVTS